VLGELIYQGSGKRIVRRGPSQAAIAAPFAFIANLSDSTVSIVDLGTVAAIDTVSVCTTPGPRRSLLKDCTPAATTGVFQSSTLIPMRSQFVAEPVRSALDPAQSL
jgi:hypothetical protein